MTEEKKKTTGQLLDDNFRRGQFSAEGLNNKQVIRFYPDNCEVNSFPAQMDGGKISNILSDRCTQFVQSDDLTKAKQEVDTNLQLTHRPNGTLRGICPLKCVHNSFSNEG